jgi:hypothetical protein
MLREDEHADLRERRADALRGGEPLVGVGGRHADIDERYVREVARDGLVQLGRVRDRGDDLDAVIAQQRGDAVADQCRVVGDHDTQRVAAAADVHLMHGHATRQTGQAHVPRLAHADIRRQRADNARGQNSPLARDRGQSGGEHHRTCFTLVAGAQLSGVEPDGARRLFGQRDRTFHGLARASEGNRPVVDGDPAEERDDRGVRSPVSAGQDRVGALGEHGARREPTGGPHPSGMADEAPVRPGSNRGAAGLLSVEMEDSRAATFT